MKAHSKPGPEMPIAAHQCKPAVRAPCPVANDWINKSGDAQTVKQVAHEAGTANHRAGSDRRAGIREGKLKQPNGEKCDAGPFIGMGRALQKEPVITDKAIAMAEHECETDRKEQNAAETGIHHAFHQYVYGFPGTAEAGFQHGESNLHSKHQERGN